MASMESAVHYRWDKKSILCNGELNYNSTTAELQVWFEVGRKCGVNMPSDRTPEVSVGYYFGQ